MVWTEWVCWCLGAQCLILELAFGISPVKAWSNLVDLQGCHENHFLEFFHVFICFSLKPLSFSKLFWSYWGFHRDKGESLRLSSVFLNLNSLFFKWRSRKKIWKWACTFGDERRRSQHCLVRHVRSGAELQVTYSHHQLFHSCNLLYLKQLAEKLNSISLLEQVFKVCFRCITYHFF